nr:DUF2242 domain-containing protein [Propionibacterium sp.]
MADWTDGPEYAPRERPDAFTAPAAEPLAPAPPAPRPAATTPAAAGVPTFGAPA